MPSPSAETFSWFHHRVIPNLSHLESDRCRLGAASPSLQAAQMGSFSQAFPASRVTAGAPWLAVCYQPDYCKFPEVSSCATLRKEEQ